MNKSNQPSERSGQKKIRRVAAVLIFLMGVALIQDRAGLLLAGRESVSWPTVAGTVEEASAVPLAGLQAGPGWRIRVAYEYQVDGETYAGDRLRFSRRLGGRTQEKAEQALLGYRPGASIEVHYDPAKPARSVILPGPDRRAWFGLIVGIVLLGIGIIFWSVPTRSHRSSSASRGQS